MALRPVSSLGLMDATDVATPEPGDGDVQAAPSPVSTPRPARSGAARSARKARVPRRAQEPIASEGDSEGVGEGRVSVPLADEPTAFVQIMVPGELQERLADVTHALSLSNPKVRHQKTILGALVWAYVDPDDLASLNRLGHTLDQYLDTDAAEVPAESKVAAHMPFSLKWRLDGAVIRLRRTRRAATAKALLGALIWRYVDTDQTDALIPLLRDYRDATKPRPMPLDDVPAASMS
jgi:hypothetical protein